MQQGKFITIEGQDGAGKSTNLLTLEEVIRNAGVDLVVTREPGGTELGEQIRELLLNAKGNSISNMAELLLIFTARAQHLQEVIQPALRQGKWVLCDRFTDATYAYQGGGREMNTQHISQLENLVQGNLRPDLTFVLDIPVDLGERRAGERSDPDRFEIQNLEFKQRVRECYLSRAAAEPARFRVVDATQNLDTVAAAISHHLSVYIEHVQYG